MKIFKCGVEENSVGGGPKENCTAEVQEKGILVLEGW